jgi:serine/arginine repetitive matrix protein 2
MADAMLSSPDPLNDTPTFQTPPKTRCSSRARSSLPSQGSSPKKQTFELDVGDQISPQKIRVTVEAGESDIENTYSPYIEGRDSSPSKSRAPKNRRRERTTTTTVPVKGLSDSEDETQHVPTPKRGRGRPRKSIGTPVPAKKRGRASTPTKKPNTRRKSIGESGVDENEADSSFQIGKGVEIGRGKGGSRSRSRKTAARKSTPASKQAASDQVVSSTTSKKGRGRRKTLLPEDVAILEDIRNDASMENDGAGESAEMSGALQPIDSNDQYPSSAYSTIRSTNAIEDVHPDILIARFHPGNETPRGTGWSSPRIIEAPRRSSPVQQYSSSKKSPLTEYDEDSVAMISVPPSDRHQSDDRQYADEEEEEARDGLGAMREFDTILESEEFSMISVDSVPSLREHLSSSPNQNQEIESAKPVKNKSLLSVQEAEYDDSFSEIPEEVLEAATPGRKAPNPQLLSVQNSRVDDTFSSIPPEILKAATPARKSQVSKFMSNNKSRVENSFAHTAIGALEASSPTSSLSRESLSAQKSQNQEFYEDSFSAIPEEVLEAATPAPKAQAVLTSTGSSASNGLKPPTSKLDLSRSQKSLGPRLLTPEETPSPPVEPSNEKTSRSSGKASARSSGRNVQETTQIESSIVHSHMPSSPPTIAPRRYTYTAHLRNNRQLHPDSTETPSIVFSSPSLPPRIQQPRQLIPGQTSEPTERPALSPITRAGRVLQDISVPSSPRNRSQSLGSPFKSPISDHKSSSVAPETQPSSSQDRPVNALPRLDLNGNLTASASQSWNRRGGQDDPFGNNNYTSNQHTTSSDERQEYSLELPSQRQRGISDSRLSTIRSETGSARSDDAMSWQAEEEVPLSGSALSTNNNVNSSVGTRASSAANTSNSNSTWNQKDAAESAAVSKQIKSAKASEVIVIDSDEERPNSGRGDEDEDFDLLLETMNSSSPIVSPYQSQGPPKEVFEKPRRSKIPSPWRKNSKRLVYNDELSSPTLASGIALGKNIANSTASKPVTVRRTMPTQQESDDINDADLSGWQIPEKSNFQPRARESGNLDLSALLANSPAKKLPMLSTSSRNGSSQLEKNSDQSQSRETSNEPSIDSRLNSSREGKSFAPIPQKQGFTPRPRSEAASSPVKQPTFGLFDQSSKGHISSSRPESSSSAAQSLAPSSPSRSNVQANYKTPAVEAASSPDYLHDSTSSLASNANKENQTNINRTLKWTQTVRISSSESHTPALISPTKSCLRSPLKTPSLPSSKSSAPSPSKAVTFVSSSPIPRSPSLPLSPTTWSHDHWLLLDRILQSWKPDSETQKLDKRRNSTRVISRLLGRKVHDARGESMVMEQWHLEAVDEFRGRVVGWEEKGVAMRVFALLIGEEKRRVRAREQKEREESESESAGRLFA